MAAVELSGELLTYQIPFNNFVSTSAENMVLNGVVTIVFTLVSIDGSMQTKEVSIEELKLLDLETLGLYNLNMFNLNVYPNPVKNVVNINFKGNKSHLGEVILYNQFGQQIRKSSIPISSGDNNITFKCTGIASGLYFLSIKSDYVEFKPVKLIIK